MLGGDKMLKKIFVFVFIMLITFNVNALVVSETNVDITKGSKKSLTLSTNADVEIKSLEFSIIYTTYDLPATFTTEYKCTLNGSNYKLTFDTPISGDITFGNLNISASNNPKDKSGSVSIINVKAVDVNDNVVTLNSKVIYANIINEVVNDNPNITQNPSTNLEPEEPVTYNRLLKEIKSDIVKINVKNNVFEYFVKIDESVTELDLVPVAYNENFNVSITNQKISELEDNKIIITVTNEDVEEKYEINVKVEEKEEIIEEEIKDYNYKWKWVVALIIFGVVLGLDVALIMKKR